MSFDAMARSIAGTLSGVFGDSVTLERPNEHVSQITAIERRDVEIVDESGQVSMVQWLYRFAHVDLPFPLRRGDRITKGGVTFELGQRLSDNKYFVEFEAQPKS